MDNNKESSQLLLSSIIDQKDDIDEKLSRAHKNLVSMINGLSDRETSDVLNAQICKGQTQYEEIQFGLLYSILTDLKGASKSCRDMIVLNRDALNAVISITNRLIHEKWLKLQDSVRAQILWFTREMIKNSATGADTVGCSLLRQIAGGDVTPKNIWLTENLLDILVDYRSWLDVTPQLMTVALYTYLRVILDHGSPNLSSLRQREVDFCVSLLREKFTECMQIGRDLVRLLQYVARIPEFEKLWRDILHNAESLSPTFTGVQQLMKMRTSRKFFVSRLTPDMETKLCFLTSKVKFGQQKRYQEWFQRQYLATPESQSLRFDLIRYICAVIHPSNEVLCSDIIPRWAVIGWLLTTCTSNVAASNAKLSLFYDWLFFEKDKDNIMNIEPAILVMYHSMRQHLPITATLLDFMCRIMGNFFPPLAGQVKQGIYAALYAILDKRVLQSLSPLFDNNRIDRELRNMIRENFTEFCSPEAKDEPTNGKDIELVVDQGSALIGNHLNDSNNGTEAEFSDEDDEPLSLIGGKTSESIQYRPTRVSTLADVNISDVLEQIDSPDIKNNVEQLWLEKDNDTQCEFMDSLVQSIIQDDIFDIDAAEPVGLCLCHILSSQFNNNLFPPEIDDESIEDSIGTPMFVLFRNLSQTHEEDPSRQPLLLLLSEMYKKQPRIGYNLLYFLKVSKVNDEKMSTYRDFCKSLDKDLATVLMEDMHLCQEDDVRLFTFLIPDIYTQFPNIAIGNTDLLHLIVGSIAGPQLQDIICQILQGHLIMFRKDSFLAVLNDSLEWETIEQYFLWQLIAAHNIPVEHILPILPKLEFGAHAEALSCILLQLKRNSPNTEILRCILCRECKKNDFFAVSILKYWAEECEEKLAELLLSQLTKNVPNTPNRKRQRQQNPSGKKENPNIEQILAHLDHIRQTCRNISFLTHELVQQGLQQVQSTLSESLKAKYGDLLALVEDVEDLKQTRVLRGRKASCASPKGGSKPRKAITEESDSSSDSSDNEEIIKPPKSKKRKTTNPLDDNSD
ncbi:integrator complex subunit 3-like [Tubulanus polymorphus]|uniref:integrator complex subunit 3-like n=1 Tax=Tubulanus polymorphus TaxID=672921 RepID=UPI003DA49565